jgi:hypothetical protein
MAPLTSGQKAVTATAAQLASAEIPVESIVLKAHPLNSAAIYFGALGVTTSTGYPLNPNEEFQISPANDNLRKTPKLSEIYVIAADVGETLCWVATPR